MVDSILSGMSLVDRARFRLKNHASCISIGRELCDENVYRESLKGGPQVV